MTRNRKIELAVKAYENLKKETKREIFLKSLTATVSFVGALIGLLSSPASFPIGPLRIMGIFFGLLTVLCAVSAVLYYARLRLFAEIVNDHEFEIVEKEIDSISWLCVSTGSKDCYPAEIVKNKN